MHASGMMCSFHRCGKTRPQGREVTCPHPHSESVAKVRQEGRSPDPGALCVFALLCVCVSLCVCYLLSHVRLGWEFQQEYWSGFPFPSPGDHSVWIYSIGW